MQIDDGTQLFLYQLVGTWGQLLFPKPWKEFRIWYDTHKAKGLKPFLDGMVVYCLNLLFSLHFLVKILTNLLKLTITLTVKCNLLVGDNRMVQKDGGKNLDTLVH